MKTSAGLFRSWPSAIAMLAIYGLLSLWLVSPIVWLIWELYQPAKEMR